MAQKKFTELPTADTPLSGDEIIAGVQDGESVKFTTQDIADLGGGATPTLEQVLTAGSALTSTADITSTAAINVTSEVSQNFSAGPGGVGNATINIDAATGDVDISSSIGSINFTADQFTINGQAGAPGDVLTSTGATTPPTWQTPSGGGTQDLQSVLDEGASANIGDAAANITAVNATDYAQWSLTPSSFEIASSNNANTAGATFSVDTDGAHITDTRANRGLQGGADYSANIQANDYAQKVYVDTKSPKVVQLAASDETTPLTTGIAKITFRMPYAMTLTAVRASLSTAQTSGSTFTVDINEGGSTILSTKLTIDNTEKTSTTAATPAVISDAALADDAEITIDVDQVGDGTAKGLKVTLIGT